MTSWRELQPRLLGNGSECSAIVNQWSVCIYLSECVCVCRLQPELGEPAECVVFNFLIPPEANRRTVSSAFQRLLGECVWGRQDTHTLIPLITILPFDSFLFSLHAEFSSAGKLSVQQEAPYGPILVSPGPSALEEELQLF